MNVAGATYTNAIGDAVLGGYWRDPEFDPAQKAFYYVRVLEIPTPRWTTYDARFFGVKRPEDVLASIQNRPIPHPSGTRRKRYISIKEGTHRFGKSKIFLGPRLDEHVAIINNVDHHTAPIQ